jgi:predicted dehydrogenase
MHLLLGYADKEIVLHASALSALAPPRFMIHGTRGSYVKHALDTQEDQLKAGLRPGDAGFGAGNPSGRLHVLGQEREAPTRDGAYIDFYRGLAASIRDGQALPVSTQDAIDVMTIIELAQRSAREGRRLLFAQVTPKAFNA